MAAISGNLLAYNVESIETDATGWGSAVNCTIARSTAHALDGSASLLATSSASGAMTTTTATAVTVPSGAQYVSFGAGVWTANALACVVTITWLNGSGGTISTSTASLTPTASAWTYIHSGASVPSGAVTAKLTVQATATAAGQAVYWDRMWITVPGIWAGQMLPFDTQCVEASASGWDALKNCTLTVSPVGFYVGAFGTSLQITATAAGDTEARSVSNPSVTPGLEYMGTAWVLCTSATIGDFRVELWWYDSSAAFLSLSSTSWSLPSGAWKRITVIADAPAGAASARLVLRPQATASAQVLYADQMGLVPTVAGGYVAAGNLLGYNAQSMEQDVTAWTGSGCTLSQSSAHVFDGSYAMAITCTGGVDAVVQLAAPLGVTAGQAYEFVPQIYWPGSPPSHTMRLDWLDASSNIVRSLTQEWNDSGIPLGNWAYGSTADLCPATAVLLQVTFTIPAPTAGTIWYLDYIYVGPGGLAATASEVVGEYAAQISIQGLTTGSPALWNLHRMMPDGTLIPVRGMSGDLVGQTVVGSIDVQVDYEAPLGVPVRWYVETYGGTSGAVFAYTTDPLTLPEPPRNTMVLKDPSLPARNCVIQVATPPDWTRKAVQGVYQPRGSSTPIIRYDVRTSRTGTLTLTTNTDAERQELEWVLATSNTLLLQAPSGLGWDDVYVQVGDTIEARVAPVGSEPGRTQSLPLTEVARPVGGMAGSATRTWQDVLNGYATWKDVYNAYSTWAGVLTGVEGT